MEQHTKPLSKSETEVVKPPLKKQEALARHQEILEQTESLLTRWMWIIGVNFLTHFMRMAVALTYMTGDLNASKFNAGGVLTAHLTIIGLANAYLSFSMDKNSFETMITTRFGLLTLFTLGEWLAQNFIQFAIIYVAASLAIVWLAVSDAYFVQMLPPSSAKALSIMGANVNRGGIMAGMALGGFIGGFISMNSVFLGSFVIAAVSLLFILVFVVGRETELRRMQTEEIAQIYRDFPEEFTDESTRFPLPWVNKQELVVDNNDIKNNNLNQENKMNESNDNKEPSVSESVDKGSNSNDAAVLETDHHQSGLDCASSIPLFFLLMNAGLRTAQSIEIMTWWNVYAVEVFDASITESTGQMVVAVLVAIPALYIFSHAFGASTMPLDRLLSNGIIAYTVAGALIVGAFLFVFPQLAFKWFWIGYPAVFVVTSLADPFRLAFQVVESPAHHAGSIFALVILSRSVIPAIQHVIIGALWNYGGPTHPWFFWWFAILNGWSALMFVCYWISKCWILYVYNGSPNSNQKVSDESANPYEKIA